MSNTYAQSIGTRYLNQLVDVVLGDTNGLYAWAEQEKTKNAFFRGIITDFDSEIIVLQCRLATDVKDHLVEIAVNGFNVKAIMPVTDSMSSVSPSFNITYMFLDNQSTKTAKGLNK